MISLTSMPAVYGLNNWQFWGWALVFVLFQFCMVGLGYWILPKPDKSQTPLEFLGEKAARNALGIAVFTLVGWGLAVLHLRNFLWLLLIVGIVGWFKAKPILILQKWRELTNTKNRADLIVVFCIGIGLLLQMPAIFSSGLKSTSGVPFYFTNAEDGMMHLAFAESMAKEFPARRPEFNHEVLTNYHYFSDLVVAEQNRLLGMPVIHSFFHFWPVWISLTIGLLLGGMARKLSDKPTFAYMTLALWYLSGEISYLFSLLYHQSFNWNVATIENSADQFLNMPQMFAKMLIFTAYLLTITWWQKRREAKYQLNNLLTGTSLLIIASTGFKIYFGIFNAFLFIGLLIATWSADFLTKTYKLSWQKVVASFLVAVITLAGVGYLVLSVSTGNSTLEWIPFVWPKLLLSSDHLNLTDWWLRMQVYEAHRNTLALGAMYTFAVGVTLLGMVGTKIIGVWSLIFSKKEWLQRIVLLIGIVGCVTIGLNTLQVPGGFNTYNFVIIAIQPLLLLSAFTLSQWWNSRFGLLKILVLTTLLIGTARPIANNLKYLQAITERRADSFYSTAELAAFDWLAKNTPPDSVIQTTPPSEKGRKSAFLAFFANRVTYATSLNIATTHGIDIKPATQVLQTAFEATNYDDLRDKLALVGIDYVYIEHESNQQTFLKLAGMQDHTVFSNEAATIVAID